MGLGNQSSSRWDPNRKPTAQEEIIYWKTKYELTKADRDRLDKITTQQAIKIATLNRQLAPFLYKKANEI